MNRPIDDCRALTRRMEAELKGGGLSPDRLMRLLMLLNSNLTLVAAELADETPQPLPLVRGRFYGRLFAIDGGLQPQGGH